MKRIYSGLQGYTMTSEMGDVETFFIEENGSQYYPNLILPNLLALRKLRDYCNEIIKQYPEYFDRIDDPYNEKKIHRNEGKME